jgi:transcriptional regulator with XRE-family HTH domain
MIGLDPAAISHFERGQRMPSLENLRKIAVVLDVSADRLLGLKPPATEWFAGLTGRDKAVVLALVDVLRKSNAQAGRTDIRKGRSK